MTTEEALDALRRKGYRIGQPFIHAGAGRLGGRSFVVVDDIAMTEPQVRDLADGRLKLDQIKLANSGR